MPTALATITGYFIQVARHARVVRDSSHNCSMELFSDQVMRDLLATSLQTASFDGKVWRDTGSGPGSTEGQFVDWLTIKDQSKSVTADVMRIRNHPLVPSDIPIYGFIYSVRNGKTGRGSRGHESGQSPIARVRPAGRGYAVQHRSGNHDKWEGRHHAQPPSLKRRLIVETDSAALEPVRRSEVCVAGSRLKWHCWPRARC